MAARELLRDAVERAPVAGHVGKSGASLERVRVRDGRVLLVKRVDAVTDFTVALTGGGPCVEYRLWRDGVLDRLPRGVGHAVLDAWVEGEETVLVLRDLGDTVLTWDDHLDAARARWLVARVAALHRHFLGAPPPGLAPLELTVTVFAPARMGAWDVPGEPLPGLVRRGWELFDELAGQDVVTAVHALHDDPAPLVTGLLAGPVTLLHGDLATVNMAPAGDDLVLIDWAMASVGPGAVDIARFVAGCASSVDLAREEVLAAYREAAGAACDDRSMHLGLLTALVWLGWNKALDAVDHPDPAMRERERADLQWWVDRGRRALDEGAL